ncbi:hypothetical protein [Rhodococcus sp. MEB041]|uniref:hypothetical protein n=1 Tax=Rhodococcus sp. MEB041 TaxID=3040323 RepID=UPI00254B3ABB|nr:hypothetical protein [Rhodococcus sp. MEB041]
MANINAKELGHEHIGKLLHVEGLQGASFTAPITTVQHGLVSSEVETAVWVLINGQELRIEIPVYATVDVRNRT